VHQGLIEAFIGIGKVDIFSGNGHTDFPRRMIKLFDDIFPGGKLGLAGPHVEQFNDFGIQPFLVINQRHFINAANVLGREN